MILGGPWDGRGASTPRDPLGWEIYMRWELCFGSWGAPGVGDVPQLLGIPWGGRFICLRSSGPPGVGDPRRPWGGRCVPRLLEAPLGWEICLGSSGPLGWEMCLGTSGPSGVGDVPRILGGPWGGVGLFMKVGWE